MAGSVSEDVPDLSGLFWEARHPPRNRCPLGLTRSRTRHLSRSDARCRLRYDRLARREGTQRSSGEPLGRLYHTLRQCIKITIRLTRLGKILEAVLVCIEKLAKPRGGPFFDS
ncbi:hypothetical protein [Sulfuriflexus sp.]|uniref:hypothetical protein n=1 Tax=Sulfuriflexus sp. TaxID=2015443 RepID=UPI0028CFC87B|nr:hypothetical protein [Sulfuriflexus sp.]MDT8405563.1 hypothetical protein [Sulfuriflexus sp.]